jgi:hypothetical protein
MADIHPCPLCGNHYFGYYVTAVHIEKDHGDVKLALLLLNAQRDIEQEVKMFARALEEWDD